LKSPGGKKRIGNFTGQGKEKKKNQVIGMKLRLVVNGPEREMSPNAEEGRKIIVAGKRRWQG